MENEIIEERKMNVIPISVPETVEYISEWKEFEYPLGHLIFDKTICGCGFTEYCLNNSIPTVLCSPRKKLLENKEEQHNSEEGQENGLREVYYFRNDYENNIEYDGNKVEEPIKDPFETINHSSSNFISEIQEQENLIKLNKQEKKDYISPIKDQLRNYIESCQLKKDYPIKIIVTYDSLHHVLDVLNEYYSTNAYCVVVDEFQSIFMDASFKATVELDFVEDLKGCANVLYLSATPMLEKYLVQLDYFKDLPFYKLIWHPSRIENVRIQRETVRNINKRVGEIITDYREGRFPNKVLPDNTLIESKELVIFVNSIRSICDIIRKCGLTPEETNIICADSSTNINKLKRVGHEIGNIPTYGQEHKMFTLCTRTTYLGADFYSTSAFTVVCSDCNVQTLTVDISLDLPQILGRQRLKENVFRNEVLILYKAETKKMAVINEKKLVNDEKVKSKEEETIRLLAGYDKMTEEERVSCANKWARDKELYRKDYIGISSRTGKATFNYLVKVADQRAYDVSRKEYQDDISIKRGIEGMNSVKASEGQLSINELQDIYDYLVLEFDKDNDFVRRMKLLCDIYFQYPTFYTQYSNSPLQVLIPIEYQNYINFLGFEKIKALEYRRSEIISYIESLRNLRNSPISDLFKEGEKYSKKQIKKILGEFYTSYNISKTPKASDISEYFDLRECQFMEDGKKVHGFEIIKKKGE